MAQTEATQELAKIAERCLDSMLESVAGSMYWRGHVVSEHTMLQHLQDVIVDRLVQLAKSNA